MKAKATPLFLLISALTVFPAAALADTRGGGETTNSNVTLNNVVDEATDIWEILESEGLTLTTASRCIVTACSDVGHPGSGTDNDYRFVISVDDTSPGIDTSSERSLEMSQNSGVDDPDSVAICSTRFINIPSGTHTISWLGSRATAADQPTTVFDTNMTVGCFDGTEL
ncbi:hypothetical protein [Methylotetracoccus oryzae]|uniref:hypothetical protein n=1 Tax=Methylotetracoccus oryzae TaxID=1919059 RepID=UPI001117E60B|nr:hypothetical protein [Methylotetracoccus oryzae]